ncbi:unnamed protein product [Echinostoma caproni]|uniref:Uncharacterized protein n=1 Tax=Echinostoma caproni TaxID=27848 RepID=A0A183B9I3_9TREM|nr:unnamed protein product [Echinostoma caproni]
MKPCNSFTTLNVPWLSHLQPWYNDGVLRCLPIPTTSTIAARNPHADYLSRHAISEQASTADCLLIQPLPASTADCLLIQPLPVSRSNLFRETRKCYRAIISCVRRGWRGDIKRRVPEFYKRRKEISVTCDDVVCYNDRIIVPPTLRTAVRNDLHSITQYIQLRDSPAKLFKSRVLRTNLHLESAEVVYRRDNDLQPSRGIVPEYGTKKELHPSTNVENSTEEPRRSERLLNKARCDYRKLELHSSCGDCS